MGLKRKHTKSTIIFQKLTLLYSTLLANKKNARMYGRDFAKHPTPEVTRPLKM